MELTTKDLCTLLNVSAGGLKSILQRDQLSNRLEQLHYKLIKSEKRGRSNYYTIEPLVQELPVVSFNEIKNEDFPKNRSQQALDIYYLERFIKMNPLRDDIARKAGKTRQTISKWDDKAESNGYLIDNGYSYYRVTPRGLIQVPWSEYAEYRKGFLNNEKEVQELVDMLSEDNPDTTPSSIQASIQGGEVIRVKSYLVQQFTEKYQTMLRAYEEYIKKGVE